MITYDTSEVEAPRAEVGSYRKFSATDTETGHELVYATNRAGEGLFHKLSDGSFAQLAGTSQFDLDTEAEALAFLRDKVRNVWGIEV